MTDHKTGTREEWPIKTGFRNRIFPFVENDLIEIQGRCRFYEQGRRVLIARL